MRAQLAALLREVGLVEQARAEGEQVLGTLRQRPEPSLQKDSARHYLRARARALEATGDEDRAAAAYGRFVTFASQVNRCGGCHRREGPPNMAWFRDWWAGQKFARFLRRTQQLDDAISAQENQLTNDPQDSAAQMKLAYLYAEKGQMAKSRAMWTMLGASERGPEK